MEGPGRSGKGWESFAQKGQDEDVFQGHLVIIGWQCNNLFFKVHF